jgi:predicted cobalt transporter CbtA
MLKILLLGALVGAGPASPYEAAATPDVVPRVASLAPTTDPAAVHSGDHEATPAVLAMAQAPSERPTESAQSTEVGRFLYNVALGVTVAVVSTLILRAIL